MITTINGDLSGSGLHIGIAAALWNQTVTDRLVEGATSRCKQLDVEEVTVIRVPGALELPIACKALVDHGCDAVVAIGTVVRGETDHYELVSGESARGVGQVALETGVPVTNAILAVHDFAQAVERAGEGETNKGVEAVDAAIRTVNAMRQLGQR